MIQTIQYTFQSRLALNIRNLLVNVLWKFILKKDTKLS